MKQRDNEPRKPTEAEAGARTPAPRTPSPSSKKIHLAGRWDEAWLKEHEAALQQAQVQAQAHPDTLTKNASPGSLSASPASDPDGRVADPATAPDFLRLLTPGECCQWTVPADYLLCGDNHLTRGGITIIAGVPGCGKSRALVSLAIAGATGADWMGLPTRARFRTLIIQAENGPARLKAEFSDIGQPGGVDLDDYVRITPPPRYGLPLHDAHFRRELRAHIEAFQPGAVGFDPWNRIVLDDKQKDVRAAIDWILECLPEDPAARPAVVIVAHLRKRGTGEGRRRGRDLLPEISGSGMIGSAARSAFILEPASPDPEDDRVVWTCAKNNDGQEGPSTAWHRRNGLFAPVEGFDLVGFFEGGGGEGSRALIEAEDVREVLEGGVTRKVAVERLCEVVGCGSTVAYEALAATGKFAEHIEIAPGRVLYWRP